MRPFLVSDMKNEFSIEDYVSFRVVTCISATLLCVLYILFFNYTFTQLLCITLYMIYKIGEAVVDLFHSFEQRRNRMDIGGISLFVRGILSLVSFYIGLKMTDSVNISIALMIITTWAFVIFYDFKKVKSFVDIKWSFDKKKIGAMLLRFLPLTIGAFIGTASTTLPRQILESMQGTAALGIYGTVATPAVIVQVASSYVFNPLLVYFGKYREERDKKSFASLFVKTTVLVLIMSVVFLIGAHFLAEWGLRLLYGDKIAQYAYLFSPVILFTTLNGFQWFCLNILIVFRKMKTLLVVNILGFVICILSTQYFINAFDLNGVSYSLIFFTVIMLVPMLFSIIRAIKHLDTEDTLSTARKTD